MTWRRPSEGLTITRKSCKLWQMANFFLGIAYGKGVVLCKHCNWNHYRDLDGFFRMASTWVQHVPYSYTLTRHQCDREHVSPSENAVGKETLQASYDQAAFPITTIKNMIDSIPKCANF